MGELDLDAILERVTAPQPDRVALVADAMALLNEVRNLRDSRAKSAQRMLSSAEWAHNLNVLVVDPDGWDRSSPEKYHASLHEQISREEFIRRAAASTCWDPDGVLSGRIRGLHHRDRDIFPELEALATDGRSADEVSEWKRVSAARVCERFGIDRGTFAGISAAPGSIQIHADGESPNALMTVTLIGVVDVGAARAMLAPLATTTETSVVAPPSDEGVDSEQD